MDDQQIMEPGSNYDYLGVAIKGNAKSKAIKEDQIIKGKNHWSLELSVMEQRYDEKKYF